MRASGGTHSLFSYDWQIAINTMRATFAGWSDRLIAGIMLLISLAGLRTWFTDHSGTIAAWVAGTISLVIGITVGRLAVARLAFHGFDGLLAADALRPPARRSYIAVWHSIAVVALSGITLIVRPSVLIVSMAAYFAGALIAGLTKGVSMPRRLFGSPRPVWSIRAWLRRPMAGVAAALILLLAVLKGRTYGTTVEMAFAGVGTALFTLALTLVDESAVCFMTIAGYGSGRIVLRLSRALVSFVALAAPGCWLLLGAASAGIVAAVSAMMLLLLGMRVLAYRLHGKRFADLLVLVLVGLLMLVGYAIPVALPVVAIAVLWHLQRRAAEKTWMLL